MLQRYTGCLSTVSVLFKYHAVKKSAGAEEYLKHSSPQHKIQIAMASNRTTGGPPEVRPLSGRKRCVPLPGIVPLCPRQVSHRLPSIYLSVERVIFIGSNSNEFLLPSKKLNFRADLISRD
jgi:hypothetical protein